MTRPLTTRQTTAGTTNAQLTPNASATGGKTSAANATPSGCAVCRAPIAVPRSCAANQPSTTRPLAALTDAPPAPASTSRMNRTSTCCAVAAATRKPPAERQPEGHDAPLAATVSGRTPQDQGGQHADGGCSDEPAGRGERQVVGPAKLRQEHRKAVEERARWRSRGQAEAEDQPSVRGARSHPTRLSERFDWRTSRLISRDDSPMSRGQPPDRLLLLGTQAAWWQADPQWRANAAAGSASRPRCRRPWPQLGGRSSRPRPPRTRRSRASRPHHCRWGSTPAGRPTRRHRPARARSRRPIPG